MRHPDAYLFALVIVPFTIAALVIIYVLLVI